jgi:hypothetical protein
MLRGCLVLAALAARFACPALAAELGMNASPPLGDEAGVGVRPDHTLPIAPGLSASLWRPIGLSRALSTTFNSPTFFSIGRTLQRARPSGDDEQVIAITFASDARLDLEPFFDQLPQALVLQLPDYCDETGGGGEHLASGGDSRAPTESQIRPQL